MPFRSHLPHALRTTATHHRGFTLVEVMVVVAIMAILITLAAPSFTPLIERWRVQQTVKELESTLYFARSEAIKRGGNVIIHKNANNTNGCTLASTGNDWGCGWSVCADLNGNNSCQSNEVLQRFDGAPNVQVTRTSGGQRILLNRWGLVAGNFLGFSLVPVNKSITDQAARGVCMSSGGRVRVIAPDQIPCTAG